MTNTNLLAIATLLYLTNIVESVSPSGSEKVRTETIMALVTVPGWSTNVVNVSTNVTRYEREWQPMPLKPERRPLELRDAPMPPPLPWIPPRATNGESWSTNVPVKTRTNAGLPPALPKLKGKAALAVPSTLTLGWNHEDPRVVFVVESSENLTVWKEEARIVDKRWTFTPDQTQRFFRVGATWTNN